LSDHIARKMLSSSRVVAGVLLVSAVRAFLTSSSRRAEVQRHAAEAALTGPTGPLTGLPLVVKKKKQHLVEKVFPRGGGGVKKRPLTIALLVEPTPFTHVCGYANRFQEMLRYLKEFGDSVEIATPDDKPEAPKSFLGFPITTLEGKRLPLYKEVCLTMDFRRAAKKMLESLKPDVIHVSTPGFLSITAALYAKTMNIPLVMSYHTHLPVYADRYLGWLPGSRVGSWLYIKALHNFADLTLVTSPQMLNEFREQGIKRVAVWPKGVDVETFNPKHRDAKTKVDVLKATDPEDSTLLYVGRLSVEKRLDELSHVLDRTPDTVKLALVGGGPHEDALKKHFQRFGDRVTFCGILRGEQLSKAYASADIFVMPSDSETLGFVVIEAMASGLAVVAARAGGIPSIVDHDKNGILAPPRDPKAFADAVLTLLQSKDRQTKLKHQARKDAEQWGWKQATGHLREKYADAINRHNGIQKLIAKDKGYFFPLWRRSLKVRFAAACRSFLFQWNFRARFVGALVVAKNFTLFQPKTLNPRPAAPTTAT